MNPPDAPVALTDWTFDACLAGSRGVIFTVDARLHRGAGHVVQIIGPRDL